MKQWSDLVGQITDIERGGGGDGFEGGISPKREFGAAVGGNGKDTSHKWWVGAGWGMLNLDLTQTRRKAEVDPVNEK